MKKRSVIALCVLFSSVASAATPSEGVAMTVRRGFFTEVDVGLFVNVLGSDGYSNLQSYLQLGVGYNIGEAVELGVHFGLGSNAQNCWAAYENDRCLGAANFTLSFINASAAYNFKLLHQLFLSPKLTGGWTLLEPEPILGLNGAPNIGGGVGIEYVTEMDHFSIGFDALARLIVGPNVLSLQFYPRVKYTF